MNSSESVSQSISPRSNERDSDFFDIIDIAITSKWLILSITAMTVLIAGAYAFLSTPIFQANSLIQVENSQNNANSAMGEMAALFNVESPASAELEILRSRLVIGKAADELQLYIYAAPDYIPIVGQWLSKRSTDLSKPGFLGFKGYVSGTENIHLQAFDVPTELEGKELSLIARDNGYSLYSPDDILLTEGKIGEPAYFSMAGEQGRIIVTSMQALPGARFNIVRSSRLRTIADLQANLAISEKGKQSGMIFATLQGPNPTKTADILNAIGAAYVHQNVERKSAEAEKSLSFLDQFLPQLRHQMQESEEKYTAFRDKHGTFDLGTESQLSMKASVDLQTKLLELEQKKRELTPRFQNDHPAIRTIDNQIADIHKELGKIDAQVRKMPDLQQQMLSLTRNVQVNSEMYVNLLNSAQQLRLVKEGKVGNVRVVDTAAIPDMPIKPQKSIILLTGLIFGLLIGFGVALIRNWLRPGIKDPSEIETALGLHIFATVPHSAIQEKQHTNATSKLDGNHVLAAKFPNDPAIESLRSLRISLQFAMMNTTNNVVMLTGPTPGIGKSFTSVNFAAVLGASGKRVLLIDADMRKGYLNQYFGCERKGGLSEIISGSLDSRQAIRHAVLPNVDFISTGILPPNPAELLLSTKYTDLLKQLSACYDLILLDSTPVLAVSDALALAPHAGVVFLIARAEVTTLGEVAESVKRLKQANAQVKGVIFNDLITSARRYGGKYGHYRYTNYGYTQET